jgi:hypothetical protein
MDLSGAKRSLHLRLFRATFAIAIFSLREQLVTVIHGSIAGWIFTQDVERKAAR